MEFVRTPKGQAATYLFIDTPLVWVEGPSDIPFYDGILKGSCRLKSAGGRQNCERLARDVLEHNTLHVVIIDGDYDVLTRARSEHRRVVRLSRYGMENYLAEHRVIDRVIAGYAREQHQTGPVVEFETLTTAVSLLLPHLAFDIAACARGLRERGLPYGCDRVVQGQASFVPDENLLSVWRENHCRGIPFRALLAARRNLRRFCLKRRAIDILPAHFVLSLLHRCLRAAIVRATGSRKSARIHESTTLASLCRVAWESPLASSDHKSLRRRILSAVNELRIPRTG